MLNSRHIYHLQGREPNFHCCSSTVHMQLTAIPVHSNFSGWLRQSPNVLYVKVLLQFTQVERLRCVCFLVSLLLFWLLVHIVQLCVIAGCEVGGFDLINDDQYLIINAQSQICPFRFCKNIYATIQVGDLAFWLFIDIHMICKQVAVMYINLLMRLLWSITCMQGCRQGGVPNFKLMLLYVQAVITKGCPKFIIVEKCDRKKTAYM